VNQNILTHFQKVGGFRKRHVAVGAGTHQKLDAPSNVYAFSRTLRAGNVDDAVVVAITPTN
jgi:alpha-amylase